MNRQILQLHGPRLGHSGRQQRTAELPVAGQQTVPHEDLPHKVVDIGRMHPVPAEIAHPDEAGAQLRDPPREAGSDMSARLHRYFFSMPAKRPVEKAICRL